jgi:hypothetical protein
MRALRSGAIVLALLPLSSSLGLAQSSTPQPADPSAQQETAAPSQSARPKHQPPCWKQAGIAPQAVNERWKIEDDAKVKIGAVCTDATLTPAQRLDKIHKIDGQRDDEIAKLVPAKQLETFKACESQLAKTRTPKPGEKQLGPCGGVIPAAPDGEAHEHHASGGSQP